MASRRLAAMVPHLPGVAPGQRARIEAWIPQLETAGWDVDVYAFEDVRLRHEFHHPQPHMLAYLMVSCYRRHLSRVLRMGQYDAVYVLREAALIGPAVLERLATRGGTPLLYDIDDPVFLPYKSPQSGWFSMLKFPWKTRSLIRRADHVLTVNRLMGDYARQYNPSVTVVPNCIDVDQYRPASTPPEGRPRVVWTGSQSTSVNLHTITPALRRLQSEREDVELRVVCDKPVSLEGVRMELREFAPETQVAELQDCHIGLVPVADTPWNRWKSFFKTVQYMAVGLPVVAQRIGSNPEMIEDGVSGFVVETQDEWVGRIEQLLDDPALRIRMGKAARQVAVASYGASDQMKLLLSVLDEVSSGRRQLTG